MEPVNNPPTPPVSINNSPPSLRRSASELSPPEMSRLDKRSRKDQGLDEDFLDDAEYMQLFAFFNQEVQQPSPGSGSAASAAAAAAAAASMEEVTTNLESKQQWNAGQHLYHFPDEICLNIARRSIRGVKDFFRLYSSCVRLHTVVPSPEIIRQIYSRSIGQFDVPPTKAIEFLLNYCRDVEGLSIDLSDDPEVDEDSFRALMLSPAIEGLVFKNNSRITNDSMMNISQCPQLKKLVFKDCSSIDDDGFTSLPLCTTLQSVTVHHCSITPEGLACLAPCPLASLDLSDLDVSEGGFSFLTQFTSLTELKLAKITANNNGYTDLRNCTRLIGLEIDTLTPEQLPDVWQTTTLTTLTILNGNLFNDASLVNLNPMPLLRRFAIKKCSLLSDSSIKKLASFTSLRDLDLEGNHIVSDHGVGALERCINLQYLGLQNCTRLTGLSLSRVTKLPLKALNVSNNPNYKNESVAHLLQLTALEALNLTQCTGLTTDGILPVFHMRSLRKLKIGGPQVTDVLMGPLGKTIFLKTIEIEDSSITDSGLALLANPESSLRKLKLTRCRQVTNRGLLDLAASPMWQKLTIFSPNPELVTDTGIVALKEKRPSTKVIFTP